MAGIVFLGLSSSVGKSTVVTIACREFAKRGYRVVPYKAFNLSSVCFKHQDIIIGYAQYIQSIASYQTYDPNMNPIFKHFENNQLTYVVHGKKSNNLTIQEQTKIAYNSYEKLAKEHDLVVCEGSGSFGEINLKDYDYANLRLAMAYKLPIVIVADISLGGVFGNLYGHVNLMSEEERALLKGIIINKFDGEIEDFNGAKNIIENLCSTKVIGILPVIEFSLPQEDGINTVLLDELEIDKVCDIGSKYIDFDYLEEILNKS